LQNERHCGDVLARKTWTPNYLDPLSVKNRYNQNQYRKKNNHEAFILRDDFIAVQHLISNAKYGNRGILPELKVITDGALKEFVSIDPHWAAFSADDYRRASSSICENAVDSQSKSCVMVFLDLPLILATTAIPPRPSASASLPRYRRNCFGVSRNIG